MRRITPINTEWRGGGSGRENESGELVTRWPSAWPSALRRLTVVVPHPDDEVFLAGLIHLATSNSVDVSLVCLTRGENGQIYSKQANPDEVARVRSGELEHSCRLLGITNIKHLDLPDGAVDAQSTVHAGSLATAIAASCPDAIVSFGLDGGYGHRDHIATAQILTTLLANAPQRWLRVAFPPLLFTDFSATLRRWVPHLFHVPTPIISPISGTMVLPTSPERHWELPLSTQGAQIKRSAATAHASQLTRAGLFLFETLEAEIYHRELYRE